ncbi:hypothetical protein [Leisingera sp. F5]|uniref:hypothetical protein n=1 Tax=Leisingera sp. F5 TaxID=1813816 RepID=UPI0025C3452F|nr:hypothetical protein [Leisingera sp. F5]
MPQPDLAADQVAERAALPEDQIGAWVWGWTIRDLPASEIAVKLEAQKAEMDPRVQEAYGEAMRPISDA